MPIRDEIQQRIKHSQDSDVLLHELNIQDHELEEILTYVLSQKKPIHSLYLQRNSIQDGGAEIIARMLKTCPTLKVIDLQFNNITEKGASMLCSMVKEQSDRHIALSLYGNKITDEGTMEGIKLGA